MHALLPVTCYLRIYTDDHYPLLCKYHLNNVSSSYSSVYSPVCVSVNSIWILPLSAFICSVTAVHCFCCCGVDSHCFKIIAQSPQKYALDK